jgi:DNA-binding NarL/FixJ family response regulator
MDLGADDYLTKPVANAELVRAIEARLRRAERQKSREFKPDFSTPEPSLKLGLTPRAAEALLWLAQGKTNSDIATILGITESTVKKHVQEMFEKLGVETRGAATVRALEVLGSPSSAEARWFMCAQPFVRSSELPFARPNPAKRKPAFRPGLPKN